MGVSALLITLYELSCLELAATRMRNEDEHNTKAYTRMQWDSNCEDVVGSRGKRVDTNCV
jgi:hypothetical protein